MDLAKNTFRLIKMLGETDPANVPDEMRETLEQAFDLINSNSSRFISIYLMYPYMRDRER